MGFELTLTLDAAAIALAILCGWRGARAPDPNRGPRLFPWRPIMALCAAAALLLSVHLVNLLGVKTGR